MARRSPRETIGALLRVLHARRRSWTLGQPAPALSSVRISTASSVQQRLVIRVERFERTLVATSVTYYSAVTIAATSVIRRRDEYFEPGKAYS